MCCILAFLSQFHNFLLEIAYDLADLSGSDPFPEASSNSLDTSICSHVAVFRRFVHEDV